MMEAATLYFVVTAFSFPFLGIYNSAAAQFRAMGRTSVTMAVSALMNIMNIIGDFVGVYLLDAGVLGVAVPTLISRAAAALIMTALAFHPKNEVRLTWGNILHCDGEAISQILHIAVPNGLENGLFALGKVLVTSIVAQFGTIQIAANGVANSIDQIAIVVVNAVNLAIITVVGQCEGAKEHEQAEHYTKKLMRISYVLTAVLSGVVCPLLPLLLRFYRLEPETLRLTAGLIVLHNVLAVLLHPTSFNLANSLRAAGDVRFTMCVGIVSMVVFRLGAAALFGVVWKLGCWAFGLQWERIGWPDP